MNRFDDELDALVAEEARRGARMIIPFLLPTLYVLRTVLAEAAQAPGVRRALWAAVVVVLARAAVVWVLSTSARHGISITPRVRHVAFLVSAWSISASFAAIYIAAQHLLDNVQCLMVAMIAVAVCALAMMSTSASVLAYVGYVTIHLGGLAFIVVRRSDARLFPLLPAMLGCFLVVLSLIAVRTNLALREKISLALELRDSAFRDALTGLRNRAFAAAFAEQRATQVLEEWSGGGRRGRDRRSSLLLVLVDLDHFKAVNDTHGHAAGDLVLKTFARLAEGTLRKDDVVARWGGEEFLVVMEIEDRGKAHHLADRIRRELESSPVTLPGGVILPVTCSVGACLYPFAVEDPDHLSWQQTLELADRALYRAKRRSRNCTQLAADLAPASAA